MVKAFFQIGHDANNFEIEMSQVPLLIYFNDEAKKRNYDKFEFLLDISQKTISFNENIKNLILQIFNINIDKNLRTTILLVLKISKDNL